AEGGGAAGGGGGAGGGGSWGGRRRGIPRPPPPQLALTMSGNPTPSASRAASAGSGGSAPVAGITGTPAASAIARASTLLPSRRMTSGGGPMKMMPAAAQAPAKSGLSDRNP